MDLCLGQALLYVLWGCLCERGSFSASFAGLDPEHLCLDDKSWFLDVKSQTADSVYQM